VLPPAPGAALPALSSERLDSGFPESPWTGC